MMQFVLENFDTIFRSKESLDNLEKMVLDLAARGKLVPQNPDDEPANELLKKIKVEKERLITEKVIKKEKPFPPITEEEIPFDIPENWEWVRLGEILTKLTDGAHQTPKYIEKGIPFLSVKDISSGVINFSKVKYISQEEHKELYRRCNPEKNDLLLTKVETTGIAKVVDVDVEFSLFVSIALLKFNKLYIYPYFLENLINSPLVKKQSEENTKGIGNKNLVLRCIADFRIPLPPLAEQQRIVEKVEKMKALISNLKEIYSANENNRMNLKKSILTEIEASSSNRDLLDTLEVLFNNFESIMRSKDDMKDLRNLILSLAVKGKLVPQNPEDEPASELLKKIKTEKERLIAEKAIKKEKSLPPITEEEIPFEIPENWEWVRLGGVGNIFNGNSINEKEKKSKYENLQEGLNYIATKDIDLNSNKINYDNGVKIPFSDLIKFKIVKQNSILICAEGGSAGKKIAITNHEICFGNKLFALENYYSKNNHKYLFYVYKSPYFFSNFKENETGIIGGVSINKFKQIAIPLPPLEEQQRIVEKVDSLMKVCDLLEAKMKKSENISKKLLESLLK